MAKATRKANTSVEKLCAEHTWWSFGMKRRKADLPGVTAIVK
jgi:hypothetical protein